MFYVKMKYTSGFLSNAMKFKYLLVSNYLNIFKKHYVQILMFLSIIERPEQPSISIYGGERTGDTITVTCSTFHTCPYSKPDINLNGIEGYDQISDESFGDGLWKITLTRTGVVKTEHSTIKCSVTHYGGITVTATEFKSAKCA